MGGVKDKPGTGDGRVIRNRKGSGTGGGKIYGQVEEGMQIYWEEMWQGPGMGGGGIWSLGTGRKVG